MGATVKDFCALLVQSRLLRAAQVRDVYRRWRREADGQADDLGRFVHWLVAAHYLTDYQAERLLHGHTDCLFLDHYKILRRVGEGPLARIYKAIRPDGRLVALKVLPPSRAADPHLRACFEREARASWRLRHPNVVHTLDTGEADGVRFIVMEYLEGEPLAEVLRRRGRLAAGEAVRLLYQAFLGLQHVHEHGLVHGHVDPANLMLVYPQGEHPGESTLHATVKLLDAGVGAAFFVGVTQAVAEHLRRTGESAVSVTAHDLAPERLSDPRGGDIRADVYGLGCVLYHCLAGQPPFPGANVVAQILRHATETPQPLRDLAPALPDGLAEVVERLLAKDPAGRYPTPAAAAQALRRFLPGARAPLAQPAHAGDTSRR